MKVVINTSIGSFSVSRIVYERLGAPWNRRHKRFRSDDPYRYDLLLCGETDPLLRSHPTLVAAVEELGGEAAGSDGSVLKVVEIPDGIAWHVCEGEDGTEWIAEDHRTWS